MASCCIMFVLTFRRNMLPLRSGWRIGSNGRCDELQDHHLSNICGVIIETYIVIKCSINHWRAKRNGNKFASVPDLKAYGETRCTVPFVPYLGTRWRCMVSLMPRPFYFCGKSPLYLCWESWVDPRAGLDVLQKRKICWLSRNSNPGSSSPYCSH